MNRISLLLGAAALCAAPLAAYSAGMFSTFPQIGGPAYCAAIVGASPVQAGTTGQGAGAVGQNGVICAQTVPAGPSTFTGSETVPADLQALGAIGSSPTNTALVSILQLGQGPAIDLTTVPVAYTVPANTEFLYIDGAQAAAYTVTLPAGAVEGQFFKIACEVATAGALNVAAPTGQTVKFNPNTACVAGSAYNYRYTAASATWFRA